MKNVPIVPMKKLVPQPNFPIACVIEMVPSPLGITRPTPKVVAKWDIVDGELLCECSSYSD
jgi:hypothetical protein